MDSQKACFSLLRAESEEAVSSIIAADPDFRNPENWLPLDGRESNFNVTSNQASDGGKALTELMTNMVDAVLMKHAFLKGVDPAGKDAPATMYEAVDQLVHNMYGGKLVNLSANDPWLKDFAMENLVIGITGFRSKKDGLPCYTFVDNGEGQHPGDFKDTFLSLSSGTKKKIPFVQGKYNMGSSGVLRYCGSSWYKLIISRRYDESGVWGWTLLRRRPSDADELPVVEFFVSPHRKDIPQLEEEFICPFKLAAGGIYNDIRFSAGTIVKLYDYQLGSQFMSFGGSRNALNENLVETILPFRMLDFRQTPDKKSQERALGIDARAFYGMEFLLRTSHEADLPEDEFTDTGKDAGKEVDVGKITDGKLGEITIKAIVLKKMPGWLAVNKSRNRIFHAVNGQVQFKQTRGHLSTCNLPALMDRAIIIVDASRLTRMAHNDVWKGDREGICNARLGEHYKNEVTKAIRSSPPLKKWHQTIVEEELNRSAKKQKNDLFQKLVDTDPSLAALLSGRDPVINSPKPGGKKTPGGEKEQIKLEFSPSFVRFEGKKLISRGAGIAINKGRPLVAKTDAQDDFFTRTDNRGELSILPERTKEHFTITRYLVGGILTIFLKPNRERVRVGDKFLVKLVLKDDSMPIAVESQEIEIFIEEENLVVKQVKPNPHPRPRPRKGDQKLPVHDLPKCVLLTQDDREIEEIEDYDCEKWPEGFSEHDGGLVKDLGEEMIYKINYDNIYHINYRARGASAIERKVIAEKYILGMRIIMLAFEKSFRSRQDKVKGNSENSFDEFVDEFRAAAAAGAASVILALAEKLPKIIDGSSVEQEE